jgi:transposase InsO family protein
VARDDRLAAEAAAKLDILAAFEAFVAEARLPDVPGADAFADRYREGAIVVPGGAHSRDVARETRALIPTVSGPTVLGWRRRLRAGGAPALARKAGAPNKGRGVIESNADLYDFITGMIAARPHASAKHVIRGLRARFRDGDARLPSYRTVQRFMAAWKAANESVFLAHSNPDAWKNRKRVAFGRADEGVTRLNQLWEMDSTSGEVMLPGGRHALIACIDVYSRRAAVLISRSSRSAAIVSLLRRCCLAWGVPEIVKTDQGKDYKSAHMDRALAGLGIGHDLCPPFTPEAKPFVERFIGTITHGLFEELPGYLGHSVADRASIEARRSFAERFGGAELFTGAADMEAADLQAACDAWVSGVYERERHGGLGGRSPFEAAAAWAGRPRMIGDARALDVLLAEAPGTHGIRTVGKKGIAVEATHFIAPELGALEGRKVHVRLDPCDMGRIWVFDADSSEFVCEAVAPERTGADRRQIAARARELQRATVREGVKDLRKTARRIKAHTIIDEVLAAARDEAGRVVALPRPGEAHETPALDEAARALAPKERPYEPSPEELAAARTAGVEMERKAARRRDAAKAENDRLRRLARDMANVNQWERLKNA